MTRRHVGSISYRVLVLGAVMIASPVSSIAQTWTGATDATWQTASNWNAAVPASSDTAVFDASSTQNLAITNGTATTVRGLRVVDPAGAISISGSSGNSGSGLTLGTGGIDMSAATQNLTLTGSVMLASGDQSWTPPPAGLLLRVTNLPVRNSGANNNNVGGVLRIATTGSTIISNTARTVIADGGGNPFVTYGLDNWAAANAIGLVVSATYTVDAFTPNTNVSINTPGVYASGSGNPSFSSVRFNNGTGPVAVTYPNTSTQTFRGILMTSTAQAVTITGGNIRPNRVSTAGASFSIIQNSTLGDLTINSVISNASSSTPVAVVKSGSGKLVLNGSNGYTGRTFINDGILQLGSGSTTGSIASTVDIVTQPGTTFAVNRSNFVTISSVIRGSGQFTQLGSGSTTLSGTNTFTGAVNVNGGSLVFASASNLGNGTALSFDGGTLVYAGGNTADISARTITLGASGGAIDTGVSNVVLANSIGNGGAGGFTKAGSGRLTLAAGGTYAGATTVAAGELRVNGPLSSATVDVAANALLSGTGALAGAVTIASAAALAPGNAAVGAITLGSLTTSGGSSLVWEFGAATNDVAMITTPSGLTINGGALTLYSEGTTKPFGTIGTYNLIQYSGSILGSGVGSLSVSNPAADRLYSFGESGGFVTLTVATSGLLAQWNVDAGGDWTTASNWTPSEPNGPGDTATFGSVITAPRTLRLDADRTIGNMVFSSANAYTIAPTASQTLTIGDGTDSRTIQVETGSHAITAPVVLASNASFDVFTGQSLAVTGPVSGAGSFTKTSGGILLLSGSNTLAADVNVRAGVLQLSSSFALVSGTLMPYAGSRVTLALGLNSTTVGGLVPNAGGLVDVGTGRMTVSSGLAVSGSAGLVEALKRGRAGGTWAGSAGIGSSAAAAKNAAGEPRAVGWLENPNGSLTFGYAAPGDTNLDGAIDILDASRLLSNEAFGTGGAAMWQDGDFNYDGLFDILDVIACMSTNLYDAGTYDSLSSLAGQAPINAVAVPEPRSLGLVLLTAASSGIGWVRRQRRSSRSIAP